jgi:type IV pilus assembly protein PilB
MILATGPTGSGKSTTLYATLNAIARTEINIITIEDPVEYRMPGINQVQVNPKAGLTFATALRSILRSDPDVVLVGEIRDRETAQIAIEAALTGHLVLSTLHTNDAPSAVTRLTEMGIEPYLVGSAVDCVIAQRLLRRLCRRCREAYAPTEAELTTMGLIEDGKVQGPLPETLYGPIGCTACAHTGYRGRLALHEVMPVSKEIERLAVAGASGAEVTQTAIAEGMKTLKIDGWKKVVHGMTSIEEVLRVVVV